MHKIKEMLMKEIYEYEEKAKKDGGGKLSAGDLETLHKLTDTVKNIDKIEMLEVEGGYSERGDMMRDGYSRGGDWVARGNYGNEHHMGGDMSYRDDGNSYARHRKRDSMGRYSRDGSGMVRRLEAMMEEAETEQEREAIRSCINKLEKD